MHTFARTLDHSLKTCRSTNGIRHAHTHAEIIQQSCKICERLGLRIAYYLRMNPICAHADASSTYTLLMYFVCYSMTPSMIRANKTKTNKTRKKHVVALDNLPRSLGSLGSRQIRQIRQIHFHFRARPGRPCHMSAFFAHLPRFHTPCLSAIVYVRDFLL